MRRLYILFLFIICMVSNMVSAANYQKVVGGDISMLTKYYEGGKTYMDADGNVLPDAPAFLAYLKAQGLNAMRVRLFVNPSNASSTHKGEGVCQDLDYVKALGKQIKDAGLNFLLDFHYSDTWTDPGQHSTPAAWSSTNPTTLGNYIYQYTVEALTSLKNAGAEPDDIQIGNEVTVGELWPTGKCYANGESVTTDGVTGTMANFALYLKRSAEACRLVCPNAKIVIHTELSNSGWGAKTLYNTLKNYNVDYDIIGLSYYPYYHGNLSVLESVLESLTGDCPSKKIQIVETGFYYRYGEGSVNYEISQAGQKSFTDDLITLLNRYSNVNGLYWWWLEANEYGTNSNITTNWYYAGLWSNDNGKPCSALASLKNFITDENNEQQDIHAFFINELGWSTVKAYADTWVSDNDYTVFTDAWPGSTISATGTEPLGDTSYGVYRWNCGRTITSIQDQPEKIQFNNGDWGDGNQSEALGFLNGAYYRYYQSDGGYVSECYRVDLPDGAGVNDHSTDFWCKKTVTPKHVGYQRAFTEGQPSTLCLPFALSEKEVSDAGKIYRLSTFDGNQLVFTPVTTTEAYTPYLFIPGSSGEVFADMGEKEIGITSLVDVTGGEAKMCGVMERTIVSPDDNHDIYGYLESNGTFVRVRSANLNPFRAYITVTKSDAVNHSSLDVVFDDVESIHHVPTMSASDSSTYTVTGVKAGTTTKGVVIRNGKKYIVR